MSDAPDTLYTALFQDRTVRVITLASAVNVGDEAESLFGVTRQTFDWLKDEKTKASDPSRTPRYPKWGEIPSELKLLSMEDAKKHQESMMERDSPYDDDTYASFRENDVQNAMELYNTIINLSEMEDSPNSVSAQHLTKKFDPKHRKYDEHHYKTKTLTALYFEIMDVVDDGHRNGFVKTTDARQLKAIRGKKLSTKLAVDERFEQIKKGLLCRKSILHDLLGPRGKDDMRDFVYCPLAYLAVKRSRGNKVKEAKSIPKEERQSMYKEDTASRLWSELPEEKRLPCLHQPWDQLDDRQKILDQQSARTHFESLNERDSLNFQPDPMLDDVKRIQDVLAHWFYNCIVSTADIQENEKSYHFSHFIGNINEENPEEVHHWGQQIKNMQAWSYLLVDRYIDDATHGYRKPRTDGSMEPEFKRAGLKRLLSAVMYGKKDGHVNVFERIGATGIALMMWKSFGAAFAGTKESEVRMTDLIYEPFAAMHNKAQHRRITEQKRQKEEAIKAAKISEQAGGPDGGKDDAEASAGTEERGRKRKLQDQSDGVDNHDGGAAASGKGERRRKEITE